MFVRRTRVLQVSLAAIFSAFVVELTFGIISNSLALVTDSIHALLDCVVTVVLLIAARMAAKPPDAEHTYGHGKIESLGGMIGGIAIFVIAVFFIYESLVRLQGPPPGTVPGIYAIVGGAYTIAIDCFRIILLRRSIRRIGGATLRADFYHAFVDTGSTLVAIIGIMLAMYGFYHGDFAAAMVLGVLLAGLSVRLIHRTAQDLVDVISPELVRQIKEIASGTSGVVGVTAVLVRKSGDTFFADITILLRGDASFEHAHSISDSVEGNIKVRIPNAAVIIHFEPSWDDVPDDAKIHDIAREVAGVRGVHNVSTHRIGGKTYADLHVMVDRECDLASAHKISEAVEDKIRAGIGGMEHVTVHLEPFVTVPNEFDSEDKASEYKVREILNRRPEIREIGRIVSLNFGDVLKMDIDCSFEKSASIEEIHDLISDIEHDIRSEFGNSVITIHPEPS